MSEPRPDGYAVVREIEGRYVTVTELHRKDDRGEEYKYVAPTHWSPDGIVRVRREVPVWARDGETRVDYSFGSGGFEKGFSMLEVADAVATAQQAAAERIAELMPDMVAELDAKYGKGGARPGM